MARAIPVWEASETNGLWYEAIQFFHSLSPFSRFGYTVKFPKWAPGFIFFKGPFWRAYFWRGLYSEGLVYGEEIGVSKSIGLALWLEGNLPFLLCFTLYLKALAISKYKPPEGFYLEGRFNGGFLALQVLGGGGLIFGGPCTWKGLFSEFYGTLQWVALLSRQISSNFIFMYQIRSP